MMQSRAAALHTLPTKHANQQAVPTEQQDGSEQMGKVSEWQGSE
jgi:hypothetical protein